MSHCSLLALALATLMVVASDAISQPSTPPERFDVRFWGFREGASPSSVAVGEEYVYVAAKDTIYEYRLRDSGVLSATRSLGLPAKIARLLRPNPGILIAVLETGFALIDIGSGEFRVRQSSGEKFGAISAHRDLAFFARYDTASRYSLISSADLTLRGIIPLTRRAYQAGEVSDLLQSAGFLLSGCMSFDIRVYRVIPLAGDSLTIHAPCPEPSARMSFSLLHGLRH